MPPWLAPWWPLVAMVITLLLVPALQFGFSSRLVRKEDVETKIAAAVAPLAQRVERLETRLTDDEGVYRDQAAAMDKALALLQSTVNQMPTQKCLHEVSGKLEGVSAALTAHNAMQERVLRIVDRHEEIIADAAREVAFRRGRE